MCDDIMAFVILFQKLWRLIIISGIITVLKMTPDSFCYLNFQWKFVTIYPVTWGGGGYPEIVTNGDMGEGGPKIAIFAVTSFLNGPLHAGLE